MKWSGGGYGREGSGSPSQNQWALGDMCEVHGKMAAVPGENTKFCPTCSWILLSLWEKQVHPRLWSRLLWINNVGRRGMLKGILRVRKTGCSWSVDFCKILSSYILHWFSFSKCNSNVNILFFNVSSNSIAVPQHGETVISSKKFTQLVWSLEI